MSNQSENEMQQSETMTPDEVRQYLQAELEAGAQEISELSDEELEQVAGGGMKFPRLKLSENQKLGLAAGGVIAGGAGLLGLVGWSTRDDRKRNMERERAQGLHS